ncbi:MAG: zinc ABC transporter substrate-binding protein [Planctomycetaceae bacterium]|nr:zinc ABC transporter substrate-binding protein [Planctomycetaceae bacterium]
MVADLVRQVGGDQVNVIQICGTGVDPHLYKPTRDDVQQILNADIVFYSGLMLEGKMTDTLEKVGRTRTVVAVTEKLESSLLLTAGEEGHSFDPHVWMDVSAWNSCVPVIERALATAVPDHAEEFQRSGAVLRDQLAELHAYGQTALGSVPQENRVLVTSHDAFRYFGRAYDLEVQGIQGISTESESGLQRINELANLLVSRKVRAVFVETSVSRRNIEALLEGVQAGGHSISIGGELFSDAMGEAGTYEGTYIGMLDHNITTVARALGGTVPENGLHGKLSPPDAGR